ncbi:carboxypeptidase regulatory-like domain-containing protein [Paenibacillus terreus]|uniref:Carboxypeptidase regulatory-like domain-containing protein n=1 Tax=Paenibacillus terreus TaxID=1387834 RepID=A0ABV5B963_9BACL
MKQKRSIGKTMLSLCLAVLLVLQTVTFSFVAYAESVPEGSETGASEPSSVSEAVYDAPGEPPSDEPPSVPEVVYAPPMNLAVIAADPLDKTVVLKAANDWPFPLTVTQGTPSREIKSTTAPGYDPIVDKINGRQTFTITSKNLRVPMRSDNDADPNDPDTYIQKGDFIELKQADYFQGITLTSATKVLNVTLFGQNYKLGTAYFTETSIKVVFDGDESLFLQGRDVAFNFDTTAKADVNGMDYGTNKPLSIFGSGYMLENPKVTAKYNISLRSNSNTDSFVTYTQPRGRVEISDADFQAGKVKWQAIVTATDMDDVNIKLPLDGTVFSNNLTDVGKYVTGSFEIKDANNNVVVGATPTYNGGELTYTFPDGIGNTATVIFETWIPKEKYYAQYRYNDSGWDFARTQQVSNGTETSAVKLLKSESDNTELTKSDQWTVALKPVWIQKDGVQNYKDNTISWTITVNHNGKYNRKPLQDLVITDVIPTGLTFKSATFQKFEADVWSDINTITTKPADNAYSFGNVNGPVRLIIVTDITGAQTSFVNSATAKWNLDQADGNGQNNDIGVTDQATVNKATNSLSKTANGGDLTSGTLGWKVTFKPLDAMPDGNIYDLLVYGDGSDIDWNNVTVSPSIDPALLTAIRTKNAANPRYWQRYKPDSFASADGLTDKVYTISQNGKAVADILSVTGFTTGEKVYTYTFNTFLTNWRHFAHNFGSNFYNQVSLFDDGAYVMGTGSNNNAFNSGMLTKGMLFAAKPVNPATGVEDNVTPNQVNSFIYSGNEKDYWTRAAYDRATNTVTFRLSVNANGINTEEMAKHGGTHVAQNIQVIDNLPEGWEFKPYSEGKAFEIYKGARADYGLRVDATAPVAPIPDPENLVSFSAAGNVGTFSFTKLAQPYVILVKAGPTAATLKQYADAGQTEKTVYNKAELRIKWGDEDTVVNVERDNQTPVQRKVIVPPSKSMNKTVKKAAPGVLEWTVEYATPFTVKDTAYLQDTLGKGLKLRNDEFDRLSLRAPDMAVYPAKLTASGALAKDGEALDLYAPDSEVKVTANKEADGTTTLTFKMTNPNKLYLFVYQTEIDGTVLGVGDKAGNNVQIMGDDAAKDVSSHAEYTVENADISGGAGWQPILKLKKVDPDGKPLQGVEFTLYNKDGSVALDKKGDPIKGITDSKGELIFNVEVGLYDLKETWIDETTYLPTERVYNVRVSSTPFNPIWVDGDLVDSINPLIVPTPARGKLTITNKVEGNGSDPDKAFEYTVTFNGEGKDGEYIYQKSDNTSGKIKSGDKITLKHGQTVILPMLPANLVYSITEGDYTTVDGYTTKPETRELSGTIVDKGDHKADFINERIVSKLTVSNTVMGNGADKTKEFEYAVSFEDAGKDGSYSYEKSDGSKGTIKSGGTFKLKDGETLDILDLPKNLKYTVTQTDYTTDEYVTTPQERYYTGVMEGNDEVAPFTNIRLIEGDLLISNTVKGKDDDKKKLFKYTITFTGEGADKSYAYKKSDGGTGMIKSGETFELTDGQTFVVQGLPTYLEYMVTQDDYTQDGYVTDESLVRTGTIPEKIAAEAHFVNTRPYLEGLLRDNNTGEIIPNAKIIVTNKKTNETYEIWTDEKGEYSIPAEADTDYTITYTKMYQAGGKDVPVEFTQKANVDSSVKDETVPADITAVGIVRFKQLDGTEELFNESFTSNMHIYLKDKDGKYIEENGKPKAFPMGPNGTFSVEGLSGQKYTMEVRYKAENGEELLFKVTQLDVKANGELNISDELVDPYGTVYDETTGDAITGKKIDGAKVTLYYANTQRNIDNGRIPGTKVTLPKVPSFPPHDNESPEQDSDANGFYAYMVFPETDYYLVVTKPGYETYTSETISVDFDIVKYNVPMKPVSSGGGGGGTGPVNPGPDPVNPDPVNPEPEPAKPEPENPVPGGGGNGTGGGGNGADNGDKGTGGRDKDDKDDDKVNNVNDGTNNVEADDDNNATDNVDDAADNNHNVIDNIDDAADNDNNVTDNVNDGADKVNNGADNGDNVVNNVNNEAGNVNKGTDNVDNGTRKDDTGSKLPNTATNMYSYLLAGFIILIAGLFLLRRKKHN